MSKRTTGFRVKVTPLAAFVCLQASSHAFAQAWDTEADLELIAQRSDNSRLDFEGEEEALRTVERLNLGASRKSRNLDLKLRAAAEFVQYSETDRLDDEENQNLGARITYSPNRRTDYQLFAEHDREDYSSSQDSLVDLDPDAPDPGTDIVGSRDQFRIIRTIARPTVTFDTSSRSTISAFFEYRESEFKDTIGLADYDSSEASVKWSYKLSESRHDHVSLQAGAVSYETSRTEFTGVKADGIPVSVTYERPFGRKHYMAATVGANQISFDNAGLEDETELIYGLFLGNDDPDGRHRYFLTVSSKVRPDSSGRIINSQSLRGLYEYKTSRTGRLAIRTLVFSNEQVGNEDATAAEFADRDYIAIEPSYSWEIGKSTTLSASYRYRQLERAGLDSDATDHTFALTLNYRLW